MVFKRISHKRFGLIVTALCVFCILLLSRFATSVSSRSATLEHDLHQYFLAHQLLQLDTSTVSQQVRDTGRLSLTTTDLRFDLELVPHDLRTPGYYAEEFGPDRVGHAVDIGPTHTFKGRARGSRNGIALAQLGEARFTIDKKRIQGLIITPTEHYYVEPAQKFSKAAMTSEYVIYSESDVITTFTGDCGVTLSEQVNEKANELSNSTIGEPSAATTSAGLQELRVATEADNEYVTSKGDAATAEREILSILNKVEGLYEVELGLSLKVVYQSAWSTANDPFSSTNPSELLGELTNFWNANRGSVARDVVHMWTGKQLDNATIGTAYLEALCRFTGNGRAAYGLSKGVPDETQQVAITAHEIGHNLSATHPNQQVPPIVGCDSTIMSSSGSANPKLSFCQYSVDEILNYLQTNSGCLTSGQTQLKFATHKTYSVGKDPRALAVADFNGDGKEDLAVANFASFEVSILLGSDNDRFQHPVNYPVGNFPTAVAAADFDRDGKIDLAVVTDRGIDILLGDGTGKFKAAVAYPVLSRFAIAAGDFNLDGKTDLVTPAPVAAGGVAVLMGNGNGGFGSASYFNTGGAGTNSVAIADFNQDGKQDIVATNSQADTVGILLGTGTGSFHPAVIYTAGSAPGSVAVADLDNNGDSDLIISNNSSFDVNVLLNMGAGVFKSMATYASGGGTVIARDLDGDGKIDVATADFLEGSVDVLHGTGAGSLTSPSSYPTGDPPYSISVGDFNGDGRVDLVSSNSDGQGQSNLLSSVSLLLGTSAGTFEAAINIGAGESPDAVTAGDFNNDGTPDLAAVSSDGTVTILLGAGYSDFHSAASFSTDGRAFSIAAGDFNNDGKQDLVTTNYETNTVTVFRGKGTGSFNAGSNQNVGMGPFSVAVCDVNGDGKQDLAVANLEGDSVSVLLGNGSGNFQKANEYPVGNGPLSVASGDFNGDNKQDLALAAETGVSILLGSATGILQNAGTYAAGLDPYFVTAVNLDKNGNQDLVVTNNAGNNISVLLGNGNGSFQSPANYDVDVGPYSIAPGDFNNDGNMDVAVSSYDGNLSGGGLISVLLGTGTGTFARAESFPVGVHPEWIAVSDLDADGNSDLAVANNAKVSVLLNRSGAVLNPPANDNFSSARLLNGQAGTIVGVTILATKEPNEPNHASAANATGETSIWYRWTAPSTGTFYFQTYSSSFPTVLAVYTGSTLASLIGEVKSTITKPEYVEVNATAGITYQIAIDGLTGDSGRTVLTWNTGSLSNDNFAFAREIRGSSGSVNGDNASFTLEPNEPSLTGPTTTGFSAWYRWTAPNTGKVSFSTTPCGDTTRLLGAYTGNFIDILNLVAVNYDGYRDFDDPALCDNRTLRFNAVAGTTYRIQLRSVAGKPFTLTWNYANPPPNDHFANALIVAGNSGSLIGTNRDATKEPGEPDHAGGPGGASIWYRWTAPNSGPVTFDTFGFRNQTSNSFRYLTALMAVYTGSNLNSLTLVAANAKDNKVTFNATAGTTYNLAIDSAPYAVGVYLPGLVPLHWGTKQVANDDFVNAQPLSASSAFVPLLGSNAGATKETGEPNHQGNIGGASVWYRWTALNTDNVSFVFNPCSSCSLAAANALIAVYTGSSVNALTPVPATTDNNHTFAAVRGITYFIAVDTRTATGGTYEFALVSSGLSARNDNFNKAQVLSGNTGAVAGDNSSARKEAGEPDHANDRGGASVWYQWKAPASGLYTFDTFGSNFDTLLAVYTGNAVNALSVVASSDNAGSSAQSRVTFDAKVDTTYYIAVDGKSTALEPITGLPRSQSGLIQLNWSNLPPPVNDNFVNAQTITGASGNGTGRNTVASKEGGEGNHAGSPGGVSIWYRWTAPASGNFTFNTLGSDFNTLLAVYTGTQINALTAITSNDDVGKLTQSLVTFNASAGTVYYIAVDGSVGVPGSLTPFSGNLVLNWLPETALSNDNFLLAKSLSGSSGSLAATNAGARKESGEPNHANDRGGSSVWYSWTAPFNGPVIFTTIGSDFDTLLAVYTGSSLTGLAAVVSNDDSPYSDNPSHILTSSLTFTATAGTTYRIAVDGSGGRFGNFALRWGREANISGQVAFLGGCGSENNVTMVLSGEDGRAVMFEGSGTFTFSHVRVGGNYSVRGISEASAFCLPLFLERAKNFFPLAGNVLDANFTDDGLRGGGNTSNVAGRVKNAFGVALYNVAVTLSGSASRTVYTDGGGLYQLPDLPEGSYQVTPGKAGAVFSPSSRQFDFPMGQSIIGADFTAQDSYNISGQTRDQNGAALSGVTITLTNGTQPVSVQTDQNGYYSFDALAGGSYTLRAAKPGFAFTPATRNITELNANQKNADFTLAQLSILTIASTNPNTGVAITVSPADNDNQANGATPFSRKYITNSSVTLTAPITTGGNVFQKWQKDGVDYSTSVSTGVTLDTNHTVTAVYLTTTAQTPAGQNVSVQLNGVTVRFANVTGAGTTTILPISPASAGQLPNGYQLTGDSIAFDISTTAVVQPPISVCFALPSMTDAVAFGLLRVLHNENGTLVDRTSRQDIATRTICATVTSLSAFVLASTTAQQLQLLLEEPGTQTAALDAVLLLRDPFPVINSANLLMGSDRNTRVMVFVKNMQLAAGETAATIVVHLVDAHGQSFDVPAENLLALPGLDFSQLTFRLPDALAPGDCAIEIRLHGQVSNLGTIRIRL